MVNINIDLTYGDLIDICREHMDSEIGIENISCSANTCPVFDICSKVDRIFYGRMPVLGIKTDLSVKPEDKIKISEETK